MSEINYRMTPIDPLISRDARPFGEGGRVRSLDWLSQSVVAGAVRTALWKEDASRTPEQLKKASLRGPFPLIGGKMYLPRPLDIVVSKEAGGAKVWQVKPMEKGKMPEGCGANMPVPELLPAAPDPEPEQDFKPEKMAAFWSVDLMVQWLRNGRKGFSLDEKETLAAPIKDERTHAKINPDTGTADEGMLFSTTGLDFVWKDDKTFKAGGAALEVNFGDMGDLGNFTAPVGGERRLARFEVNDKDSDLWKTKDIQFGDKIRLVLATSAVFAKGWLPGWIDGQTLEGQVPGTGLKLRLVSAVTGRWQPLSGWSYEDDKPKAMRRAVPAGSVYFFQRLEGDVDMEKMWLRSVCEDKQDQRDGLGLALWGNW